MRSKFAIVLLASTLAACGYTVQDQPSRGMSTVNVPVISRTDYAFDASAPDGRLGPSEAARLDGWFRGMELGYGDTIYVDGPYSDAARADVARIAGQYGLLVSSAAPVTLGTVQPGTVRVVVSRTRAAVPGCPNWSEPASPNFQNRMMSNSGCALNSNMAAMVANPTDLIHGREGTGVVDALTGAKAINSYRAARPTGENGLKDISTKGGN
ncbi:CpaD family pilus assembly protein [Sphingomonas sp. GCM10030256]|uniref:CpaD family pilus assembly protein n=1 Tax=Sphingomonas sp. GCM10030256 TaxID=3273427 RepID=UPI00361A3423